MGVYIHGMEMPEDGETVTLTICADGLVFEEFKEPGDVFHAVPVPPHGRLIDADALGTPGTIEEDTLWRGRIETEVYLASTIYNAPTIIPAEPCNNLSKPCKEGEA